MISSEKFDTRIYGYNVSGTINFDYTDIGSLETIKKKFSNI